MGRLGKEIKNFILMLAVSFILAVCLPGASFTGHAADSIGAVNGSVYYDFDDLVDAVKDEDNTYITIEMYRDWDAYYDSDYNELIEIGSDKVVTFEMYGHMFNRDIAHDDYERNGELIYLNSGSTLTINGGVKTHHLVDVHSSTDRSKYASTYLSTNGGTLTGGSSTNSGGGIHSEGNCNIILNDVTIAGCRAQQNWNSDGYGGGIRINGKDTTLTLNNSTITGCFSYNDGGGIYVDNEDYVRIELNNSHVDGNFAGTGGGGICLSGEYLYIVGDGKSTVSNNKCVGRGGGIYVWNDCVTLSGLSVNGNTASEGGGIYTLEATVSMTNLNVKNNSAGTGAGLYFNNDRNTIASCTITDNSGVGVWLADGVDDNFKITGTTVIKDNSDKNLYMSASKWQNNRVLFQLSMGAEVWVYYNDNAYVPIMVTPGAQGDTIKSNDCTKYIRSEQPGFYFGFDSEPNMRKIMRYFGSAPTDPDPTYLNPQDINDATNDVGGGTKAGKVGTVSEAGTDYNLLRGFFHYQDGEAYGVDSTTVFYYSDGLFFGDLNKYNNHLGTLSLSLATASKYLQANEEERGGNVHYNKHAGARQFLADIGIKDQDIYVNDSYVGVPQQDSIGVMLGHKALVRSDGSDTGRILVPLVIRSGGYEAEWAGNMNIGKDTEMGGGEHKGFAIAANTAFAELNKYLDNYGLMDDYNDEKIIFWVVGFSRGGATANLTAKRLVEKINADRKTSNQVVAYCCEAPKGGTDEAQSLSDENYYCIHNIINKVDIVPYVGPMQMGLKRYGVDHYIPGTDQVVDTPIKSTYSASRGNSTGDSKTVTTYSDNEPLSTKQSNAYTERRGRMIEYLKAIDPDIIFDDYFRPMAMDFAPTFSIYENGNYYDNTIEDFIDDFVRFLQEGTEPSAQSYYSQAIPNRPYYVDNYQSALMEIVKMVMMMDSDRMSRFSSRAGSIMDKMGYTTLLDIYTNLIGNWHNLDDSQKQSWISFFWTSVKETGALEYLTDSERNVIEKYWPQLMDMIFRLIDADYQYKPGDNTGTSTWAKGMTETMTFLATYVTYSHYISSCHYPEIAMAWMRTYDSWFTDEKTEYIISAPASVSAPKAFIDTGSGEEELTQGDSQLNKIEGRQKLILDNKNLVGEAIYYDIYITQNEVTTTELNKIYRGGIELSPGSGGPKEYKIDTYCMSYGVKSSFATYKIKVYNDKHEVIIPDGSGGTKTLAYKSGDTAAVSVKDPAGKFFTRWTVKLLDELGNEQDDVTESLLGSYAVKQSLTFTMPEISDTYSYGYKLKFEATYDNRIENADFSISAPVAGQDLDEKITVKFSNKEEEEYYDIVWSYDAGGVDVPASGTAYDETVYTATIKINPDAEHNVMFVYEVGVTTDNGDIINAQGGKVTRNGFDGSISIIIRFGETGTSDPSNPKPENSITLKIQPFDLNLNKNMSEETVVRLKTKTSESASTITTIAPVIDDEKFMYWDFGETGITSESETTSQNERVTMVIPANLSAGEYEIKACYIPIVQEIAAEVEAPVAGNPLPGAATSLNVKISNVYKIHPDNIELTWSPNHTGAEEKAEYMTAYTASIAVKPSDTGTIQISPDSGANWIEITPQFIYSEDLSVTVNGEEATCNQEANAVLYTFSEEKYHLESIENPDDIREIPHGTELSDLLPDTVRIKLKNGDKRDALVYWDNPVKTSGSADPRDAAEYSVTGTVELPGDVDNEKHISETVTLHLSVKEADTAAPATASIAGGEYASNLAVTLSTTTEGGSIHYTKDGTTPTESSAIYNGEMIYVDWNSITPVNNVKKFVLKTITYKAGLFESNVSTFEYTLDTKVDVPKPAYLTFNNELQVGIPGSKFYEITNISSGGVIDSDRGDAKGKNAGDYTATLKIKDGYKWYLGTEDDGKGGQKPKTDTADQQLVFTIIPLSLKEAVIKVKEDPIRLTGEKAEPAIGVTLNGSDIPSSAYDVIYSNNKSIGTGTVGIAVKENYINNPPSVTFRIIGNERTLTFDPKGGKIDGKTGKVSFTVEDGSVFKLPTPVRSGYTFKGWISEGKHYTDSYSVTKDAEFTADWKAQYNWDDDDDDNDQETGDDQQPGINENPGVNPEAPGNIPAAPVPSTSVDVAHSSEEASNTPSGEDTKKSPKESGRDTGATVVYETVDEEEMADNSLKPSHIIIIFITSTTVLLSGGVAAVALYWKNLPRGGGRKGKRKGK